MSLCECMLASAVSFVCEYGLDKLLSRITNQTTELHHSLERQNYEVQHESKLCHWVTSHSSNT